MSIYGMQGLPAPIPIPLRGGKVLRRALRAALNLVPGPVGRFRVDLCGPAVSIMSETVNGGLAFPLAVFTPGAVAWAHTEQGYSQTMESKSAIARQGALLRELTGRNDTGIGFSPDHGQSVWTGGVPDWLLEYEEGSRYAALSGHLMGLTGLATAGPWGYDMVAVTLAPALVAGTFIGQRSATVTYRGLRFLPAIQAAAQRAHSYMAANTRDQAASLWARVLSAGFPTTDTGAPEGALEHIGLRSEIWSSDTDPGGEGESSGRADGDRAERNEDDDSDGCSHCRDGCEACESENEGACSECGRDLT